MNVHLPSVISEPVINFFNTHWSKALLFAMFDCNLYEALRHAHVCSRIAVICFLPIPFSIFACINGLITGAVAILYGLAALFREEVSNQNGW